ncbi:hypothetical protein LZK77_24030 (plasmid) [Rhizobium leguminosarum]|nr:hypothetical protein LZK77_24030 [Rhizobium leguminosarum]
MWFGAKRCLQQRTVALSCGIVRKTDVLFVSHLHADHINGIDRLQAMAPAKTVVVPYLDTIERLLFVLSDFEQGTVSRSSLDYFEDPAGWWLSRGAERVIFLQQGRPDDAPLPPAENQMAQWMVLDAAAG